MGWNNKEIFIENKYVNRKLIKLKWFLIQFIKKYPSQYRYLGKYLLDWFLKKNIFVF